MTMIFSMILIILSLTLIMLNYMICMKSYSSREKSSIFECGFDPSAFSRLPFSMHFFLVALIFLIFDVEISLLIPIPYMWHNLGNSYIIWLTMSMIMILLMGTLIEWLEGSLDWKS